MGSYNSGSDNDEDGSPAGGERRLVSEERNDLRKFHTSNINKIGCQRRTMS